MRLSVLAVIACVGLVAAALPEAEYQDMFTSWASLYGKAYAADTFFHRYNIFKGTVDYITERNAANLTFTLALNQFSDLTLEEFREMMLGRRPSLSTYTDPIEETDVDISGLPNDVDWRTKGAVQKVKNQGQCGSCWAFSATGAVESFNFLKDGTLLDLAEQQLVDCCRGAACGGSAGCNGGQETDAIAWLKSKGQCLQKDYPYTARTGTCKTTCSPAAHVGGVKRISGEAALATGLNGLPVTVAVDAGNADWQSYHSGIYNGRCGKNLNHAILAVGYTDQYWIVKNSWGGSWGVSGYMYMIRGKNICGVASEPSYPI